MHRLEYSYAVSIEVTISPDEVEHLLELAARHYDGRCQSAGKFGGFLYGLAQAISGEGAEIPQRLSTHEVDTLCKITELLGADITLSDQPRTMLKDMLAESHRVNWPKEENDDASESD